MLLPTKDKDLSKQIHTIVKEICRKNVGIGCRFNYDCDIRDCCIDDSKRLIQLLEKLDYHKGLPPSLAEKITEMYNMPENCSAYALRLEIGNLYISIKKVIEESLNSGDGTYRP